ncbi:MAG: hypothetical protein LIO95_07350 [Clostridiales bacterium]|nr:hypothetical protein [Clostridiales bacterium]
MGRWSEVLELLRQYGGEDLYRYVTENGQAIPRNEQGDSLADELKFEDYNNLLKDLRDDAKTICRRLYKRKKSETQQDLQNLYHKIENSIY